MTATAPHHRRLQPSNIPRTTATSPLTTSTPRDKPHKRSRHRRNPPQRRIPRSPIPPRRCPYATQDRQFKPRIQTRTPTNASTTRPMLPTPRAPPDPRMKPLPSLHGKPNPGARNERRRTGPRQEPIHYALTKRNPRQASKECNVPETQGRSQLVVQIFKRLPPESAMAWKLKAERRELKPWGAGSASTRSASPKLSAVLVRGSISWLWSSAPKPRATESAPLWLGLASASPLRASPLSPRRPRSPHAPHPTVGVPDVVPIDDWVCFVFWMLMF